MAKKSVHGVPSASVEANNNLYSLMTDGVILVQWRYEGRLQRARVFYKPANFAAGAARFARLRQQLGAE